MKLTTPSKEKHQAFLAFVRDLESNDPQNAEFYHAATLSFSRYVESLHDEERGENLPEGYVPCSHCWLENDDGEILGVLRIRHNIETEFLANEAGHIGYDVAPSHRRKGYATRMLHLGLQKARALGLSRVLISADEGNIASRKTIEANGGELEGVVMGTTYQCLIARYWVDLSQA